jgi:hypothetical protein
MNARFGLESRRSTQEVSNGMEVKSNKVDCPFDPRPLQANHLKQLFSLARRDC